MDVQLVPLHISNNFITSIYFTLIVKHVFIVELF